MRDSIPEELRDRQREVHDFMLEQAEKDYKRKTQSQERNSHGFSNNNFTVNISYIDIG